MNNVSAAINNMSFRTRSDGSIEGRLTVCGKRKSFYGKTKADVKNKAKQYLSKINNGYKDPKRITLNEYVEYWLTTYKLNKIEPASYSRLYCVYEKQIHDSIGKKMIGSVTTSDIQELIDNHANPPNGNIKPLAASGLRRIMHLLRPCMQMAVRDGTISSNPCDDVKLPTESCVKVETKQQRSLSDEEIEVFKNTALRKSGSGEYVSRNGIVLVLIANLGLRLGEAIALEWGDIDMQERIIHINKIIQSNIRDFNSETATRYDRVKQSSKTKSGVRVLAINDTVAYYLNELREYDKRNHIVSKYVCCTNNGDRSCERTVQRSMERIVARANLGSGVTVHTLRHTFGSTLIRRGVDISIVSELMGHSNITITYNTYIHTIQEEKAKAMEMIKIC